MTDPATRVWGRDRAPSCLSGRCGLALRRRRFGQRLPEQSRERGFERRPVRQAILQREHDEPELGHRAALGLQVDWFGVQQRAADRNDDQRAAPYVRSLLIPERQLP